MMVTEEGGQRETASEKELTPNLSRTCESQEREIQIFTRLDKGKVLLVTGCMIVIEGGV